MGIHVLSFLFKNGKSLHDTPSVVGVLIFSGTTKYSFYMYQKG